MKRNSKPHRQSNQLNFQKLEPRELLAGDVLGIHQVAGSIPTGTNILANGDFETVTPGADNFYAAADVPQWQTRDGADLNIFNYSGDYGNVLDLDSRGADFDRVYQDLATEDNTSYLVTFDFRNHPAANPGASDVTYDFEVWWGGQFQGIFTGTDIWQTGSIRVNSTATNTELLFCERGHEGHPGSDGLGPLLDNIRVLEVDDYLLSNNSFEETSNGAVFNRPWHVDGWSAMSQDLANRWLKIQNDPTVGATDGQRYLNLDATQENRDIIYRDLDTRAGVSYYVTFDMRIDGANETSSDELRVRWNGSWAGTFQGDYDWQNYGLMVTANSESTRLSFLETDLGDGSGPLIDNVKVHTIVQNDLAVETGESRTFIPNAGSQNIGSDIAVSRPSNNRVTSATITLNGVRDGQREILAVAEGLIPTDESGAPKIIVEHYSSATRQLVLVGEATAEDYTNVLRSLAYFNNSIAPTTTDRSVTIQVTDNALPPSNSSASGSITVGIETDQRLIDDTILQKFIADNGLTVKPVTVGENTTYVVIDEPGTGLNPTINSTVRVAYNGKLIELNSNNKLVEGKSFDASSDSGISFPLSGVIQGWQVGIPEFKTGGRGMLLIPSSMAYGTTGSGPDIGPNTVLLFDVNLLQVI